MSPLSPVKTMSEKRKKYKFPPKYPKYSIIDPETYLVRLGACQIRPNKALNQKTRAETPWTAEIGVFKKYLREGSQALL